MPEDRRGKVELIPIGSVAVMNPRVRNKHNFDEIVESVRLVGLKRPITVSRLPGDEACTTYGLVCGQGRLEACQRLGQTHIPAIVIQAEETDCLVMSLVENCARRQHSAIDLLQDVKGLKTRGYTEQQIADKIGVSWEWVNMIGGLLERGEHRLVAAVESGMIPISVAVDISRADDKELQKLLAQAYAERKLTGIKLIKLRRLLEYRRTKGKKIGTTAHGRSQGPRRPTSTAALVRVYREEAGKQRLMIKKAEMTQSRLLFVIEAFRSLCEDNEFVSLIHSEGLAEMPRELVDRLSDRSELP